MNDRALSGHPLAENRIESSPQAVPLAVRRVRFAQSEVVAG